MAKLASLWRFVLCALAASTLLSNCMTDSAQTDKPVGVDQQATALARADSVASFDYKIAPRDILDIVVFQVPDLNKTVQVSADGNVTLPLIGNVPLLGKTPHDAEQIIADKLKQKYMQSPQVTVSVKQYGQKITVSGEVKLPRVLVDEGNVTLTQAVANAGGLGDLSDPKRVHVARANGQQIQDDIYNLQAIQAGQATDPVLRGGDIVVVEQSGAQVALKNVKDLLPFAILATIL